MKIEELKSLWNTEDILLDKQIKINHLLLKEISIEKIKSNLNPIKRESIFEIFVNSVFLYFLMNFMYAIYDTPKLLIPAVLLAAFMILDIIFNAHKIHLYQMINSSDPIIETQKRISKLKYLTQLEINLLLIIIPLFSAPFMIIGAFVIFQYDLYALGSWLISFTIGSILVAIIIVFFLRKFPNKKMEDMISLIKEIKDFESN